MKQKTDIFHAISFSNSNYAYRLYSTTIIIHSKLDDTCPNKYPYFNFTMSTTNGIMRTCLLNFIAKINVGIDKFEFECNQKEPKPKRKGIAEKVRNNWIKSVFLEFSVKKTTLSIRLSGITLFLVKHKDLCMDSTSMRLQLAHTRYFNYKIKIYCAFCCVFKSMPSHLRYAWNSFEALCFPNSKSTFVIFSLKTLRNEQTHAISSKQL